MHIGGHVSIAGGISRAIERAKHEGFEVLQTFAGSPRSFKATEYSQTEIDLFNEGFKQEGFKALFFHAIYLLNLASEKEYLVNLSVDSLISYLQFGAKVNCTGTIFHIGSYKERTFNDVKEQIVVAMKKVLANTPTSQALIVENAAGGGGRVGATLEELIYFHNEVNSNRLKFCIDTQHLFATGVNVADSKEFGAWLSSFDKQIGIKNMVCLHINDSMTELGSKHDRHENIGAGLIGEVGFRNILKQPLLKDKYLLLEVPGQNKAGPDRANADRLRKLLNG